MLLFLRQICVKDLKLLCRIYECNSRCKCDMRCHNRVVQHGLTERLQVFKTERRYLTYTDSTISCFTHFSSKQILVSAWLACLRAELFSVTADVFCI